MEVSKAQTFNNALCISHTHLNTSNDNQTVQNLQSNLNNINFKYNAVFNSADTYYIILDRHLNIVDFNYASLRLIKTVFNKKMILGDHISNYLNEELSERVLGNCARALSGNTFTVEQNITFCPQGNSWWQAEYSPAYNEHQHIAGVVFSAVDITARKAREAKIELQNEKLRAISIMQSHDLRGPLCTLTGLLQLIKTEGLGDMEYLAMMETTVAALDKTIRDIVDCANEV